MRHPILSGSGYKFYAPIWIFIIIAHGGVLYSYHGFPIQISLIDSLTYNIIFAAITPGFWYVVTFANLSKDDFSLASTHLVAALLSVGLWSSLSGYLLSFIFSDQQVYLQFSEDSNIWRFIVGVMYYSISVLLFYLIKYNHDMQSRVNREFELQSLLKDSELRLLKSQINPHFIFNSLNSISALALSKPDLAREMVIKLSDFLRYSLDKDSIQMNTLGKEIENATLYLDIEKVRFGSKLSVEKEVSSECLDVQVPNLILQPLFENAIKYGVHESLDKVIIKLKCEPKEDVLHISIENNFDSEAISSSGAGIGLKNVSRRLSLVFERTDLLQVNKNGNVFSVMIKIPISRTEND